MILVTFKATSPNGKVALNFDTKIHHSSTAFSKEKVASGIEGVLKILISFSLFLFDIYAISNPFSYGLIVHLRLSVMSNPLFIINIINT